MEIPQWIKSTNTDRLKGYLNNKKKGCREKTRDAILEELHIRKDEKKEDTVVKVTCNNPYTSYIIRGAVVAQEDLTNQIQEELKKNNITWMYLPHLESFIVGMNIGEIEINKNLQIPTIDDTGLLVKLIKSGITIDNRLHTHIFVGNQGN